MKKWGIILVVAVLSCGAGVFYLNTQKTKTANGEEQNYREAKAEYRPMRQEVTCSGYVEANLDVEIKCKATGQVIRLPFDVSDTVAKDDLLMKIDPIDEERNVRLAEVKLMSAQARLDRAKQNVIVSEREIDKTQQEVQATLAAADASRVDARQKAQRMETLLEKEYASPEEVESANVTAIQADSALKKAQAGIKGIHVEEERLKLLVQDINLALADVESCRIEVENASQRLKETQVFAPMDGVISDRPVQVGQIISSPTMNVGGGTTLLTLSDLSRIFVIASVDESDIGIVRPGQPAVIGVDAFPDMRFRGEVVRVAIKGRQVSNVVTFEVKIEVLDEERDLLMPEMTADVNIIVALSDNALSIPAEAVLRRGPHTVVLTPGATGAEPRSVQVTTGIEDGLFTEIVTGLGPDATVLIPERDGNAASRQNNRRGFLGGPPPGAGPPM